MADSEVLRRPAGWHPGRAGRQELEQVPDIVLDPFGGSGSTLIACEKTGRQARLIELDPKYCDVIILRWQDLTGEMAVFDGDGRSYRALAGERRES